MAGRCAREPTLRMASLNQQAGAILYYYFHSCMGIPRRPVRATMQNVNVDPFSRKAPMRRAYSLTFCLATLVSLLLAGLAAQNQAAFRSDSAQPQSTIDRDLLETDIPTLQRFYATHKYTVTQVVQWYLTRIAKYNGIYKAVETLHEHDALKRASELDAEASAAGRDFKPSALWGVPIVIKANTSVEGKVTTDGWSGFK